MINEIISRSDISHIKLDAGLAAIYIKPSEDQNIHLQYSPHTNFHVVHEVAGNTLHISAEVDKRSILAQSNHVLRLYLPPNQIKQLDIIGNASFIHLVGENHMLQACRIDVTVAAVYLENSYADTMVKTVTGAIRLKNDTIRSNIFLETQIGAIDVTLNELPDDVSIHAMGLIKRNTFLQHRNRISPYERYQLKAASLIGVINIHR